MKDKAVIFDLDGTLCDTTHRQHFMQQTPKDWKSFYAALENDPPNHWCRQMIWHYFLEMSVILLSGRPEKYRERTQKWLESQEVAYDDLIMRPDGDFRTDYVVKKELYEKYLKDRYEIVFVVDDRKQVVDMWRREGLVCLQCAEGNF